ncbi:GH116 family glycosyl hydrolase [Roseofilum sp. BLCC_M154]|uniref:GH116 family glycosyl hydrolase n=1 Tax=Roseofilum acuticapitatum BLCC-M154 TaxID=3022444 RepID=A0ABT7AXQ5_9CYAN|nr:GH116 family glycosyl hydrolase [Roseofilum acuticapitatum]MDJ1171671.1 GH116 family glycosyl hydrolase [Roseofilum acuticapitatum BLCC-M154]
MTNQPFQPQIPSCAWQRPLGLGWDNPYTVRYASNLDDGPWHGMPLGGLGAGCIGRSPRGDFNLWHIDGGEHIFKTLPACQFSVFEQTDDGRSKTYALSTQPPTDGTLSSWQWYPPTSAIQQTGTYSALYPQSWYHYQGVYNAQLLCEQFSPVIPHNYQETSYPLAIFEWTAHNPTDKPLTLSIMLTWENTVGWFTNAIKTPKIKVRDDGSPVYEYQPRWGESTDNYNRWIENNFRVGCLMSQLSTHEIPEEGEGQWAIATIANPAVEVFYHTRWNPTSNGDAVWSPFASDGSLSDSEDESPAASGERLACAIAVRFTLRPGRSRKIPFILAWDFPVTEFGYTQKSSDFSGQLPSTGEETAGQAIQYYRRYTDFFGRNGKNAWSMVRTALKHSDTWKEAINEWRKPILGDRGFPETLKMALFNELYLLTDGGTLWTAGTENDPIGQFGVLECLDYRWYESLDVRLYGGFALTLLWPKLEKSVMLAFARAIPQGDNTPRIIGYNQAQAVRKIASATPHDLGAPNEHPWEKTNYTSYQDCNLWKDLGCDFVLQVYRYFLWTGAEDLEFLQDCWGAVVETLDYLKTFDRDGDGIPENSGAPDQTFDDWQLKGISAYCGGLWLAALEAAIAIGQRLQQSQNWPSADLQAQIEQWSTWLTQSKPLYQKMLWNGQYYNLDSESNSKVVMADQLCGQFYAQLLNLPSIVPEDCTQTSLETIYHTCFTLFNQTQNPDGAALGVANGVNPDGSPENPNATHPLEIWTGINFGLAAFMLQQGMKAEALTIAEAVVNQIYTHGLQFRTPEALTAAGTFRASHYLRAMAIWGLYQVSASGHEWVMGHQTS